MTDETVRAHAFIDGHVQGVFYRASTREMADELDVDGWVRNLEDGRVEAIFEGDRDSVDRMLEWCHDGSQRAIVDDVSVEFEDPVGMTGFEIVR